MSEKIKSSDIFEGEIFKVLIDGAESAKVKVSELNEELVKTGLSFKKELKSSKPESVKDIEALIASVKKLNEEVNKQIKLNTEQAKLDQQLEKVAQEQEKLNQQKTKSLQEQEKLAQQSSKTKQQNIKLTREETKEEERLTKELEKKKKVEKDLADAYKQLAQNTRDLKNESKRLGAEMIELEKQGKKNSAEYYKLSRQYKETTKSAVEGDKALKKLDAQVGDNFRNVGNYSKAIGGLRNAFMQLGLAFGVVDVVKSLFNTQIQLDSLNLSLRNVSSSTKEYEANFAFLKDISLSYGQDLISIIESYKNFIASTSSSNLSLAQRKRIYESVIKAGSALALSNDNIKGSLLAISQMFSKGTVSAEELRQQLGERLPGAFGIMADSMGVTEAELGKLMKEGKVLADEVMPRFAIMLERNFGANAKARLETFGGAWNVLKNNVALYFDQAQKNVGVNKTLAGVLLGLGENIGSILNNIRQLIIAFVTYKAIMIGSEVATKALNTGLTTLIKNAWQGEKSITAFGMSLKSIGWMAVITGLVKLTEHWLELANGIDLARKNYEKYRDSQSIGRERATTLTTTLDQEYKKTLREQKLLLETKQISDKIFKERMEQAKIEREQAIKDRLKVIEYYQEAYVQQRELKKEQNGGEIPKKAGSINPLIYAIPENLRTAEQKLLIATKKVQDDTFNAYHQFQAKIYKLEEEKQRLLSTLNDDKVLATKYSGGAGTPSKDILKNTKELRDLNTEYNKTNEYLSRQLEILKDIEEIKAKDKLQEAIDKTANVLQAEEKSVNLTGKYNAGAVQVAIQAEYEAKKKYEEARFKAEKEDKKIRDTKAFNDELTAVEEQEAKKNKDLRELRSDYFRTLADYEEGLKQGNLTKSGKATLEKNRKWLKETEPQIKALQKEIQDGADKEKAQVYANDVKRQADTNLEIQGLQVNHEKNMANIRRDSADKTNDYLDKFELIRAEKRLEVIKDTAESVNSLIQKSLEHYINMAERRIDILDKRMERMSTQADFLREKAVAGNIQAQESLAEIDKQQIETEKQKINEQKSIQRLQIAMTIFQAYSNNIQSAKVGENPFTKTLTDVTLLSQLANTVANGIPSHFDGTEDTGTNGQGVDGKGGFYAILHPNERVIPKALNSKMGDLSNFEIAKLAEDFHRGEVMRKGEGATQLNLGAWSTDVIVSKLESLENTIKNKPESNIELGEIVGGVMHIIDSKKTGNTRVRNISRFS